MQLPSYLSHSNHLYITVKLRFCKISVLIFIVLLLLLLFIDFSVCLGVSVFFLSIAVTTSDEFVIT